MEKLIIIRENGENIVREMSFNEVRKQFENMLYKAIHRTNAKVDNEYEMDDFKQELDIELWKAFDQYDIERDICFSTYLHYKIMKGVGDFTRKNYENTNGTYSLNLSMGEDGNTEYLDLIEDDNISIENDVCGEDYIRIIFDELDTGEKHLLKNILIEKIMNISQYAEDQGISRQAAHKRIKNLKTKVKQIISRKEFSMS